MAPPFVWFFSSGLRCWNYCLHLVREAAFCAARIDSRRNVEVCTSRDYGVVGVRCVYIQRRIEFYISAAGCCAAIDVVSRDA